MPVLRFLRPALAALLLAAPCAHAQQAQRNLYTPNNNVRSAAIAADTLYVGGDFSTLGPPTGPAAVLDKVTGEPDLSQARVQIGGFLGSIWVSVPDGEGGWYVGGEIEQAGGEPRRNLARVLADGSVDPSFAPDPQAIAPFDFGRVRALVLADGVLYVSGRFDEIAGQPRQNVAALDAGTGAPLPLSVTMTDSDQGGGSPRGEVSALLYKDGVLYLGGDFLTLNGTIRQGAAALDAATGALLPWDLRLTRGGDEFPGAFGFGIGPPPGDTTLYVGGLFDAVRGVPRPSGSAEVSLADPVTGRGGVPTPWTTGFGLGGGPITVAETVIWSHSGFATPLWKISRVNGATIGLLQDTPYRGGRAVTFDPTGGPSGQGVVYLAATLDYPGDPYPSQYLVAVDAATEQILPDYFEDDPRLEGGSLRLSNDRTGFGVRSLVVEPGPEGRLFAVGDFYGIGPSEPRRFLAGLDLTTGRAIPFAEDYVIFSSVEDVAISPDNRYLYFSTFNGLGVADLQTGVVTGFPAGGRAAGEARAGQTEVGSTSERPEPIRRAGPVVARADGSPAPPFAPPVRTTPTEAARASVTRASAAAAASRFRTNGSALVATEDRLYVNGSVCYDRFTGDLIWATPIVAFLSAPTNRKLLLVEAGPPGAAGDTLFLSGSLIEVGGLPRDKFAALDAETGAVLDWNVNPTDPPNGVGNNVAALGPPGGARIYLSGSGLDTIGGEPRDDLAAASRMTGEVLDWVADPDATGGSAMAAQPGPGGGVGGGVIYSGSQALDAETGALLDWDLEPSGGAPWAILPSERHGRIILAGTFTNSLRGSGHAYLAALTPARPFTGSGPDLALTATVSQTTVAPGGAVRFDYTLANDGPAPATGDLFFMARRGQTTVARGVVRSGTVPAGRTVSGSYTQRVPQGAPTGSYSYTLSVGRFPDLAVASESFAMTVAGSARAAGGPTEWSVEDATPWETDGAALEATSRAEALGAFPNPFGSRTAIRFEITSPGPVRLAVYNVLGREVAVLADGRVEAGRHEATFDARGLASGVYVWRLVAGERTETGRVTLLR